MEVAGPLDHSADAFNSEFQQTFQEKLIMILQNFPGGPASVKESACQCTQTKRWAEGSRVPAPLAGGGSTTARGLLRLCPESAAGAASGGLESSWAQLFRSEGARREVGDF